MGCTAPLAGAPVTYPQPSIFRHEFKNGLAFLFAFSRSASIFCLLIEIDVNLLSLF